MTVSVTDKMCRDSSVESQEKSYDRYGSIFYSLTVT